jgi:hypothetical protein
MKIPFRVPIPAVLAAAFVGFTGCGDEFTGPDTASVPKDPANLGISVAVEAAHVPGVQGALGLSPALRTAMSTTLAASLAELGMQPAGSMIVLQDFFQEIDAQQQNRLQARDDLRNPH